ncbi:leucyl aminopeptidase [Pelagibacterium limicola]|uniref:leucyl aminopeptidase n=1 Tax=Pelagibacterium limicola TaxID=2791022 RepID=UPI0018AFBA15|nr:leucyl aminopeptidase [Pelagibacterium limicola]
MPQVLNIAYTSKPVSRSGAIVIYVAENGVPDGLAEPIWARTGLDFKNVAGATGFAGKPGHMIDLVTPSGLDCDRLVVLGRGRNGDMSGETVWADRGGSLFAKLDSLGVDSAAVVIDEPGQSPDGVAALLAGLRLRQYSFDRYKTAEPANGKSTNLAVTVHLRSEDGMESALAQRMATVEGTLLARTLVNEPPNVLGPVEFSAHANLLSEFGIEVEILAPEDMEKLGMGALLAVAQGSERPARLVVMQWKGGAKEAAPLAFVGKGVVFDTGGISIKPALPMFDMKGDMGGAAAVTGLMKTLALRKAPINAVGIIGLVENMPDGKAYRPGDIVTAMSGKTIEIINTDAEGRLVLADALWYTQSRFKPSAIIDLATLTGAVTIALAHDHAAVFSNDDALADRLIRAGLASGEKCWRMPMSPAYAKLIESRFADMKNSGGRPAGSITAAQFLAHFIGDVPWAHIDIAGTAFGVPNTETNTSWGTGFGVALLDRLVRDHYENQG